MRRAERCAVPGIKFLAGYKFDVGALIFITMLSTRNGNLYRGNAIDGTNAPGGARKRKYGDINRSKYKRYADMPLTVAQKQQISAMTKRAQTSAAELKYIDTSLISQQGTWTYQLNDISDPASGNTDQTRIGDEISVRDIELRYGVYLSASDVSGISAHMRVCIIQSYADNTSGLTGNSWFFNNTTAVSYISMYNHDNRRMYKVLYDEDIALSTTGPINAYRTVIVKPGRKKVRFQGTGVTGDGHIYVVFVSSLNTSSAPYIDYNVRLNYTDS